MAEDKGKQLQPVDLVGIGNLLEGLIVEDVISCKAIALPVKNQG